MEIKKLTDLVNDFKQKPNQEIVMEKQEMRKFRNVFKHSHKRQLIDEESVTIPNQTMTVKELYNRFVVGAPLPPMSRRKPVYDDEDDNTPYPAYMELDELYIAREENAQRVAELKNKTERKSVSEVSSATSDAPKDSD